MKLKGDEFKRWTWFKESVKDWSEAIDHCVEEHCKLIFT